MTFCLLPAVKRRVVLVSGHLRVATGHPCEYRGELSSEVGVEPAVEKRIRYGGRHGEDVAEREQDVHQLGILVHFREKGGRNLEDGHGKPADGVHEGYAREYECRTTVSSDLSTLLTFVRL